MVAAVSAAQHVYCRDLLHEYSTSGFVLFQSMRVYACFRVHHVHNCG